MRKARTQTIEPDLSNDLIEGAEAIAVFLWADPTKQRRVYHFADKGVLPIFRMGDLLHARKSTLREFIARREQEALTVREKAGAAA